MIKLFSEDSRFIVQYDDVAFAIKIRDGIRSVTYFLSDGDVKELQAMCKCYLQNKVKEETKK